MYYMCCSTRLYQAFRCTRVQRSIHDLESETLPWDQPLRGTSAPQQGAARSSVMRPLRRRRVAGGCRSKTIDLGSRHMYRSGLTFARRTVEDRGQSTVHRRPRSGVTELSGITSGPNCVPPIGRSCQIWSTFECDGPHPLRMIEHLISFDRTRILDQAKHVFLFSSR